MPTVDPAADRGLDPDGFIRREGSLDRVAPEFAPVVAELRRRVRAAYPQAALYLYGSVPRGTARPGRSDLDAMVVLPAEPTPVDRATLDAIETDLDAAYPQIDGAGILLTSRELMLSDPERYDGGFFTACLCTPVYGEDLAASLPRYRPTVRLARDTNGDIATALERIRERLRAGAPPDRVCRNLARKLVRTGFTLVMPRWDGWTSDMELTHRVVTGYHPGWRAPLRRAVELARAPDGTAVSALLEFGEEISREYAARIGLKPDP